MDQGLSIPAVPASNILHSPIETPSGRIWLEHASGHHSLLLRPLHIIQVQILDHELVWNCLQLYGTAPKRWQIVIKNLMPTQFGPRFKLTIDVNVKLQPCKQRRTLIWYPNDWHVWRMIKLPMDQHLRRWHDNRRVNTSRCPFAFTWACRLGSGAGSQFRRVLRSASCLESTASDKNKSVKFWHKIQVGPDNVEVTRV